MQTGTTSSNRLYQQKLRSRVRARKGFEYGHSETFDGRNRRHIRRGQRDCTIRTTTDARDGTIQFRSVDDTAERVLVLADTGAGISGAMDPDPQSASHWRQARRPPLCDDRARVTTGYRCMTGPGFSSSHRSRKSLDPTKRQEAEAPAGTTRAFAQVRICQRMTAMKGSLPTRAPQASNSFAWAR